MVSKCANPECSMPFLYLGKGKLFLFEIDFDPEPASQYKGLIAVHRGPSRRHLFWLCDHCCSKYVVSIIQGKAELVPRDGIGSHHSRTNRLSQTEDRPAE